MKKILRILLILILVILTALIVTPVLFKKQLLEKAKEVANTSVNAKIDFSDLKLSFFKDFPRLTASLYDVSVVGIETFEGDTLVAFDQFSATVNVMSLIKKEAIKVRSILLDHPRISAIVLEDGSANWDIAPESEKVEEEEPDTSSGSMDLNVALKKFEIRNARISYNDMSSAMKASLDGFNFLLSGDLGMEHTALMLATTTESLNLTMGGVRFVKNAILDILINLDADMVNMVFTLEDNSFAINDLVLLLEGMVSMPEDGDMSVDMAFATKETSFKSLLSMVPAVYMKDFEDVETSGQLSLAGTIKGALTENHTPSADIVLKVSDARFAYPDLPKSAENIQIDVGVHYDGIQNDNTVLDVNTFHVELGDNPIDLEAHVITPISDPQVSASLAASINFASLSDVIPLEDVSLDGMLDANLDVMGKMSSLEEERYEDFKADGMIKLQQFKFNSPDIPQAVFINNTEMRFSPQFVALDDFDATIGSSDIKLKGNLYNFLPFIFNEEGTVSGTMELSSNLIDLNEFMSGTEEDVVEETEDSVVMSVIEIPGNVDFTFESNLKKVKYDNMDIDNMNGIIIVRDQKVILKNLSLDILQGSVVVTGEYNAQDIKSPLIEFALDVRKIDIPEAFETFVTVQKLAPVAERTTGKISTKLDFTSFLDSTMMPDMNSIVGNGNLASELIQINNSETFNKIGDILKTDKYDVVSIEDLDIKYSIRNGRVYIQPYQTKIFGSDLIMKGDQGIDMTMNYEMKMKIPRSELGGTAQSAIDGLAGLAANQGVGFDPGETIDVKFMVTGTFDDPKVRPMFEEGTNKIKEQVKEQVKEVVEEKVEEVKQEVKEDINREAEKIMADAQVQADRVKYEAKLAGEELVKTADREGKSLIEQAGRNPIKKVAAETAAKTMKTEAEKKAKRLEDEANVKADNIMKAAQEKADKLK
ncbi:AsmA-like C-terminal region-containing protein [Bacteroidota bacterium]